MCGRFYLDADAAFLLNYFKIKYEPKIHVPEAVIFPTHSTPVVIQSKGERRIGLMQWGLKLPKVGRPIINSRAETISSKPLFKASFDKRRCIVPANGFFEWSEFTDEKKKPKYTVELPNQPIMCMAGIYTKQKDETGEENWRFSIVTREANASMGTIHHRMPLILEASSIDLWLNPESDYDELDRLLSYDIGDLMLNLVPQNPGDFNQLTIDT